MATEKERTDFGMTDKGIVVLIRKQSYDDSGESLIDSYEVRCGVRTVGEYTSRDKAERVAKALVA